MINKIIFQINTYFDLLEKNLKYLQLNKSTYQILLDSYLKKDNTNFEEIITELEGDKQDFLSYLYEIEIRTRALKDLLNVSLEGKEIAKRVNQIILYMYNSKNDYNDYAVNWSDLSVIEVFETTLLYPSNMSMSNKKTYLVIIQEGSPEEIDFCNKVEEIYYNTYKELIQVKTKW